ncbi:hypothetical protein [Gordonia phthalatica]|uniref:Uncharacterized protein n=1 Tax=Gordonia phthalatica TaxID=1136941 RepID=A0A0N9N4G1_9ACTN|nr:hypothetical protein [Gordonia phthalatica]ALG85297.1 hypothetical protein ACH46_13455 [Gordonia phthalatica]
MAQKIGVDDVAPAPDWEVPLGWVVVSASDVPSGGEELRALLADCLSRGLDDPYDIADELQLDFGLVRHGLEQLLADLAKSPSTEPDTGGVLPEPSVQKPSEPEAVPAAVTNRFRKAARMVQKLDPARAASARVLLKAAASRAPLTIERAKTITRLSGDEFEDILDDLVIRGELLRNVDGGVQTWVRP